MIFITRNQKTIPKVKRTSLSKRCICLSFQGSLRYCGGCGSCVEAPFTLKHIILWAVQISQDAIVTTGMINFFRLGIPPPKDLYFSTGIPGIRKPTPTKIPSLKLTASSPLKMAGWKSSFLLGHLGLFFWCKLAVSFREGHLGKFLQFINLNVLSIMGETFGEFPAGNHGSEKWVGPSTMSFSYINKDSFPLNH